MHQYTSRETAYHKKIQNLWVFFKSKTANPTSDHTYTLKVVTGDCQTIYKTISPKTSP